MHPIFLQQAIDLAADNVLNGGGPFGALVVKNQQIIASSGNRVVVNQDPTAHAEVMAIRAACQVLQDFQLADTILYTSCEPCPMCLGAIYWARVSQVYYACTRFQAANAGFDDSFIYDEIPKPAAERTIPMYALTLPDVDKPFKRWQTLEAKVRY